MGRSLKGQTTKNKILASSRKLFYLKGYNNTTMREISADADTNLGLIKYYFTSKQNIALLVYWDIFLELEDIINQHYPQNDLTRYLLSVLYELSLAIDDDKFYDLFVTVTADYNSNVFFANKIISYIKQFAKFKTDDILQTNLTYYSIFGMKPAIITGSRQLSIPSQKTAYYYLSNYIYMIGEDQSLVDAIYSEYLKMHFTLSEYYKINHN